MSYDTSTEERLRCWAIEGQHGNDISAALGEIERLRGERDEAVEQRDRWQVLNGGEPYFAARVRLTAAALTGLLSKETRAVEPRETASNAVCYADAALWALAALAPAARAQGQQEDQHAR